MQSALTLSQSALVAQAALHKLTATSQQGLALQVAAVGVVVGKAPQRLTALLPMVRVAVVLVHLVLPLVELVLVLVEMVVLEIFQTVAVVVVVVPRMVKTARPRKVEMVEMELAPIHHC
jgi:hypothetical protein